MLLCKYFWKNHFVKIRTIMKQYCKMLFSVSLRGTEGVPIKNVRKHWKMFIRIWKYEMSSMYMVVGKERSVCYVFVSWPFDFHRSTTASLVFHRKSYYQLVLIDLLIIHVNSTNLSGSQPLFSSVSRLPLLWKNLPLFVKIRSLYW